MTVPAVRPFWHWVADERHWGVTRAGRRGTHIAARNVTMCQDWPSNARLAMSTVSADARPKYELSGPHVPVKAYSGPCAIECKGSATAAEHLVFDCVLTRASTERVAGRRSGACYGPWCLSGTAISGKRAHPGHVHPGTRSDRTQRPGTHIAARNVTTR